MTTLNDIKATITMSIDPMEEILDDLVDEDMMNYNVETLEFIEYLEKAIDYLKDARNKVEDLIG